MFLNTLKWVGVGVLMSGLAFTGVGVMARQNAQPKPGGHRRTDVRANAVGQPALALPRTDTPAIRQCE